ncbi:MAG: 4'-phosphopantetheinyl transferase family protein [Olsenella profusa]
MGESEEMRVTCYVARIVELPIDWERSSALVAPRYQKRARGKAPLRVRQGGLLAGLMLRRVLGVTHDDDLVVGEQGKLSLARGGPHFCLSHGDDIAVLGVAAHELGVDVERMPERYGHVERDALRYVLSDEQLAAVDGAHDPARAFVRAWTRMEAVLKADGRGLSYPVRGGHLPAGWRVSFVEFEGYGISCATHGKPIVDLCPLDVGLLLEP